MRVEREFRRPDVVQLLQTLDEDRLAQLLTEDEMDEELAAAIQHSKQVDRDEDLIPLADFLDAEKTQSDI